MKRSVYIIWGDKYHPADTYAPTINAIFGVSSWDLAASDSAKDLLSADKPPDLAVFLSAGLRDGDETLSLPEQTAICDCVDNGMGILYIHAGLTRIAPDTPIFGLARGRFIMHPEGNPPVYCCALSDAAHPAAHGLASFEAPDEHYFCAVDVENTKPFLCARSNAGTEIAGWAHPRGKGRVCCLTPGHTAQMTETMKPLIERAASWCVKDI